MASILESEGCNCDVSLLKTSQRVGGLGEIWTWSFWVYCAAFAHPLSCSATPAFTSVSTLVYWLREQRKDVQGRCCNEILPLAEHENCESGEVGALPDILCLWSQSTESSSDFCKAFLGSLFLGLWDKCSCSTIMNLVFTQSNWVYQHIKYVCIGLHPKENALFFSWDTFCNKATVGMNYVCPFQREIVSFWKITLKWPFPHCIPQLDISYPNHISILRLSWVSCPLLSVNELDPCTLNAYINTCTGMNESIQHSEMPWQGTNLFF